MTMTTTPASTTTDPKPDPTSRRGIVILNDRRHFEGTVRFEGAYVHFKGRLRVKDDAEAGGVSYREVSERTWPSQRLREIRWLDGEAA
jgi:hypothetical protein